MDQVRFRLLNIIHKEEWSQEVFKTDSGRTSHMNLEVKCMLRPDSGGSFMT